MQTLSWLIESSLARSAEAGEPIAGAHQLATGALEMSDGCAEEALKSLGTTGDDVVNALATLEEKTLADLGLESLDSDVTAAPRTRVGKTDATFEAAVQAIHDFHNEAGDYRKLNSAHVLAGVASVEHGVTARALSSMNIERVDVVDACRARF